MRLLASGSFVASVLVSTIVLAQSSHQTLRVEDPPTFRSGIQYIEVDAFVTDRKGNPVRDLTRDDFTLFEDGNPRQIANFSLVDLSIEPPASRKALVGAPELDVVSNVAEGRMYVMLLDGFIDTGAPNLLAARIARQFVEEAVGADDQVAVIGVQGSMSAAQAFTNSRHRMLAAIDRVYGLGDAGPRDTALTEDGVAPRNAFNPSTAVLTSFSVLEEVSKRLGLISGGCPTDC